MKKLCISLVVSNLATAKTLTAITTLMHNFIANFVNVLDIYKEFAGNRINELGNIPRRDVVPKFSDLEVIALSATAEALGIDCENLLFKQLEAEKGDLLPNLISCCSKQLRQSSPNRASQIRPNLIHPMGLSTNIRPAIIHSL